MDQSIDPRYRFTFVRPNGSTYSRQVYHEALYAFTFRGDTILAAARVVPQSGLQYALYELLREGTGRSILRDVLPEAAGGPEALPSTGSRTDLLASVGELLPDIAPELPSSFLEQSDRRMEAVISEAMVLYGIEDGLSRFGDPIDLASIELRGPKPAGILHFLAGTEDQDAAWVNLSFEVDRNLKRWMREHMAAGVSDEALARHSDFEQDVYTRLYTNPEYLAFVGQVMNATGGYISPVVRDFLAFYTKRLNERLEEYAESEGLTPDLVRKRLESLFGTVKGRSHHYLNYQDLSILGYAMVDRLQRDELDPDMTEHSFKVDPSVELDDVPIREVEGKLQRFLVSKFVEHTFNIHHNIQRVHFVDGEEDG